MKNKANLMDIGFWVLITIIAFTTFSKCTKKDIKNTDITTTQATTQPSTDTQNNQSQRIETATHSEKQNNNQTSSINNKSTIQSDKHISSSSQTSVQSIANAIKKSTQNYLGEGEKITNVTLNDRVLTVYVDLSKADTSIVPIHEIAWIRIDDITSKILELDEYYSLWDSIVLDFGTERTPHLDKSIIIDDPQVGKYFDLSQVAF